LLAIAILPLLQNIIAQDGIKIANFGFGTIL